MCLENVLEGSYIATGVPLETRNCPLGRQLHSDPRRDQDGSHSVPTSLENLHVRVDQIVAGVDHHHVAPTSPTGCSDLTFHTDSHTSPPCLRAPPRCKQIMTSIGMIMTLLSGRCIFTDAQASHEFCKDTLVLDAQIKNSWRV